MVQLEETLLATQEVMEQQDQLTLVVAVVVQDLKQVVVMAA